MLATLVFYGFSFWLLMGAAAVVLAKNPVHSVLFLIFAFFNAAGLFLLSGAEFLAMMLVVVYVGAVAVLFLFVVMMLDVTPTQDQGPSLRTRFQIFWQNTKALGSLAAPFLLVSLGLGFPLLYWGETWPVPAQGAAFLGVLLLSYLFTLRLREKSLMQAFVMWLQSCPLPVILAAVMATQLIFLMMHWAEVFQAAPHMTQLPAQGLTNTHALGRLIYTHYASLFQVAGVILLVAMVGAIALTHRRRESTRRQDARAQMARRKDQVLYKHNPPVGQGVPE